MGLTTIEHRPDNNMYGPPIALGSAEVRPIDFAAVYSALSRNGQYIKPNPILRILD
jgi:membrane carboxypeptidase/penicillin-binding protein